MAEKDTPSAKGSARARQDCAACEQALHRCAAAAMAAFDGAD
jgi:hypothetical protein